MNTKRNGFDPKDWEDFVVSSIEPASSGRELFSSYKMYKKIFDCLPKSELLKRGWIKSSDDLTSMSRFFRDIHSEKESRLFRKSDTADTSLVSLWLSKVKSQAEIRFMTDSIPKFGKLEKSDLRTIAQLSVTESVIRDLPVILAQSGVILIYLRDLPRMKLDGAVFKISSGNPVIGMSLRFSRLDYFWFTLMHELSHIVLHLSVLNEPILNDFEEAGEDDLEVAANRLAKTAFVERGLWRSCEPKYNKNEQAIFKFAKELHVHPSIIAGLIRKDQGDYRAYSKIVNTVNIRKVIFEND